jgi:Restriction endonuclease
VAINFSGAQFAGSFGEWTGYKSGLALTEQQFQEIFAAGGYDAYWPHDPDSWIRIRSEQLEEIFAFTLAQLGVGPPVHVVHPIGFVFHRVKNDSAKLALFNEVSGRFVEFTQQAVEEAKESGNKKIDPRPFLDEIAASHGAEGLEIALMLTEAMIGHQIQSPWNVARRVDWADVRDLDELFRSEKLDGPHGEYFDERFANFLSANFEDKIGAINWRQFEGLAAEYFKREGYAVELGPGRNDDGVDIRLRPEDALENSPTVVLVQCKRERDKIGKTVVKALWADIVAEGAESGIIVTTSSLAPGATATRTARAYPIIEADRNAVRGFVDALKTPGSGVFLGE